MLTTQCSQLVSTPLEARSFGWAPSHAFGALGNACNARVRLLPARGRRGWPWVEPTGCRPEGPRPQRGRTITAAGHVRPPLGSLAIRHVLRRLAPTAIHVNSLREWPSGGSDRSSCRRQPGGRQGRGRRLSCARAFWVRPFGVANRTIENILVPSQQRSRHEEIASHETKD